MIPLIAGVLVSLGVLAPDVNKIGVAAWCIVNKVDSTVQCNYNTKQECEDYRASDETCVANPEPGKKY